MTQVELADKVPKMHSMWEKAMVTLGQQVTQSLRRSEASMMHVVEHGIEKVSSDKALKALLQNIFLRNALLLHWEGNHPCASLKLVFAVAKSDLQKTTKNVPTDKVVVLQDPYEAPDAVPQTQVKQEAPDAVPQGGVLEPPVPVVLTLEETSAGASSSGGSGASSSRGSSLPGTTSAVGSSLWSGFLAEWEVKNVACTFEELVAAYKVLKPFSQDLKGYRSKEQLEELYGTVFERCTDVETYDKTERELKDGKEIQLSLMKALNQSSVDVKSYVLTAQRKAVRDAEKAQKAIDDEKVVAALKSAEQQAESAKSNLDQQNARKGKTIFAWIVAKKYEVKDLMVEVAFCEDMRVLGTDGWGWHRPWHAGKDTDLIASKLGAPRFAKTMGGGAKTSRVRKGSTKGGSSTLWWPIKVSKKSRASWSAQAQRSMTYLQFHLRSTKVHGWLDIRMTWSSLGARQTKQRR